jgi:hypothetical protein
VFGNSVLATPGFGRGREDVGALPEVILMAQDHPSTTSVTLLARLQMRTAQVYLARSKVKKRIQEEVQRLVRGQ